MTGYETLPQFLMEEVIIPPQPFQRGAEKDVYNGELNGKAIIVKIYREYDVEGQPIDRGNAARTELNGYIALRNTPLSTYTPLPYGLYVDEKGQDIGLIIEVKSGDILGSTTEKVVPKETFDELENNLLLCHEIGPVEDMLSDANIGFDGESIWFAEVHIGTVLNPVRYQQNVITDMKKLRKYYQR